MKRRKRGKNREDDDNGFAEWGGYMAAKKSKLSEQFNNIANSESTKQSDLFKGISIFVNGYTNPTADELKQIMCLHGGTFHHYHYPSKTTFIIASNLPDTKVKQLSANQKIIKPEWISESLAAGKLLDYTNYLLYSNHNRTQPKLNFCKIIKSTNETNTLDNNDQDNLNLEQFSPELFSSSEELVKCDKNLLEMKSVINTSISNTVNIQSEKPSTTKTLNANDPKFLSEFYNNSRLHHISTLGATFKQHICNLREESKFKFPERQKLRDYINNLPTIRNSYKETILKNETIIMHIDMDCFFVSVGLRNKPELKGKPVAVTHSKGGQEPSLRAGVDRESELQVYKQRIQDKLKSKGVNELGPGNMAVRLEGIENKSMSEIASCSYEARKAGVKNGMFMGTALKLCPNLQTIPYDFVGYKEVAFTLYNTIAEYTLNIEAVSCDEMFVDISELLNDTGATVDQWATYIRGLIRDRTGCPCSTGFGANRLQARMATRTAKPNGQFHLIPEAVEEYMKDIKVGDLPGVGYSTTLKFESFDIKTCGDLQLLAISKLHAEFGKKIGKTLYDHCRGIDERQLVYEHERKSVSAEVNYGIRFTNNEQAETFLRQVAMEVHSRLTEIKMKGKCVTLKLMIRSKDAPIESSKFMGHGICDHVTKSSTLSVATCDSDIIVKEVLSIAQKLSIPPEDLRGIGVQISRLEKLNASNATGNLTKLFSNMQQKEPKKIIIAEQMPVNNSDSNSLEKQKQEIEKCFIDQDILNIPADNQTSNALKTIEIKSVTQNEHVLGGTTRRGKGRGRGRGGKTIERKKSNNNITISKFFNTDSSTSTTSTGTMTSHSIAFSEIDLNVLSELPSEIQHEILKQYQQQQSASKTKNMQQKPTSPVKKNFESEVKHTSKIENPTSTNNNSVQSGKIQENNFVSMFSNLSMKEILDILQNWVVTQNSPELCDVKMLGDYLKQLALNKKLNELYNILRFLYRVILNKKDCGWHSSYFQVIKSAQEGMLSKYGNKIKVFKDFNCKNKCHLK